MRSKLSSSPASKPAPRNRALLVLALISWLPLLVLALLIVTSTREAAAIPTRLAAEYGGGVLCFLAGIRFGGQLVAGEHLPVSERIASVAVIFGLAALVLEPPVSLALLVVGFGGQGALDAWAGFQGRLPQAYVTARTWMTWLFALTLVAILLVGGLT